ncbi:MAG: long-chain fatty acid--CoA ligase [Bacteroidales bacterium]|nr:long-chain fatty acid--CoA ligase [Bacteroidales bacterium]MCF8332642.1 long-chain fatty acid--CoA ligase [Bacteroidales bacterium]
MNNEVTRIFDLIDLYKTTYKEQEAVLGYKENGVWKSYTAKEYVENVNRLSTAFLRLGVKPGDNVATIINNSPEWNFTDMALLQIGAIQVPIYPTISLDNYKHIFTEAEIKIVIVSERAIYEKIKPALGDEIEHIFTIEPVEGLSNFRELYDLGTPVQQDKIDELRNKIGPYDVATIIYTSGTTARPKGVMLTHHNFLSNVKGASKILEREQVDTALSFLPLCHVYERMLTYVYQYNGLAIYYAESIDKLGDNLKEVKPGIFCAVPRVLEKTYDKIVDKGRNQPLPIKIIFYWAIRVAQKFDHHKKLSLWYKLKLKIANILIFKKWREGLGNNVQIIVSGGATLQSNLARTFWAAGIRIFEGYGATETSPVIAVTSNEPGGVKIGTVGPVLQGVKVRIAQDGEILCKGPNVMKGYYRHPELTREVIDSEGWFHTGDVGHFEDGKYLKITDRKKEMFKTSGGKYIAPQVIESKLKESPFIENVLAIGEGQRFTAALIVPNFYHLRSWCKVKHISYSSDEEMINQQRIIDRYQREVDELNEELDHIQKIKRFRLLADQWGIETGELSPTLKLKRRVLYEKYADLIDEIYENNKVNT